MNRDIYEWLNSVTRDTEEQIALLEVLKTAYPSGFHFSAQSAEEIERAINHLTVQKYLLE